MSAGELPASISEPGKLPERFKDAGEVSAVANQMLQADIKRACLRAQIAKLHDGEPIYSLDKLRKTGQSWRARTNYRGLEGAVSKENTLDYDLETEGEGIVEVCLEYDRDEVDSMEVVTDWQTIIADEFKWLLHNAWPDFNYHIQKRHLQKNLWGLGAHIFPDATGNWMPRTPHIGEVLFPDGCPLNFHEDGDYFMLRDFVPAFKLAKWIRNEKQARELGWKPEMVWKALADTGKQSTYGGSTYKPEEWERRISEGDIGFSASRQSGVWLNHVFARDLETSKVSQWTVAENAPQKDYLFHKKNRFEDWPIDLFPYDIGNGSLHSIQGLGERMKEFFEMMNRLDNAMVDQVMISSYPNMKQTVQNMDPNKMRLAKIGGLNWLPYGAEPSLVQFPDMARGPMALRQSLQATMIDNNRGGLGASGVESRDRMTAEEYALRIQEANRLSTGTVAMQRSCLSRFYKRVLTLLSKPVSSKEEWAKLAAQFRKRCMDRGVPIEAFKKIGEVKAILAYGKGSSAARTNAFLAYMQTPAYLETSEDRKLAVQRGLTASMFGFDGVKKYSRSVEDNEIPNGDESFAVQENNALVNGGEALAAARQNHSEHLAIHLNKGAEIVQGYQTGEIDPQMAFGAITAIGIHSKQHLDFLAKNPTKKAEYQNYFNQWQALSRIADKLQADLESAAQAQAPEEEISDELKIGMARVEVQRELGELKINNNAALKARSLALKAQMDQQKMGIQQRQSGVKLLTDVQRNNAATAAQIAQNTAKTTADIQNKNRQNGA